MPTYQYRCRECSSELEMVQKFTDPALTECPTCSGQLRKVFNAVGVVFKGSGFYRTDSRPAEKSSEGSDSSNGKSETTGTKEKKSSESTPTSGGDSKQPATSGTGGKSSGSGNSGSSSTAA